MVVDPAFDRAFYKLAGFRMLGRRAVRVDILERLADLIRPALSWKAGIGARPEGAYDGSAFMVTPPMMSILGANGDDIEEILKGLGYRAEPKPAAEVKARLEALDQAAREAAAKAAAETGRPRKAAAEAAAEASDAAEAAHAPARPRDIRWNSCDGRSRCRQRRRRRAPSRRLSKRRPWTPQVEAATCAEASPSRDCRARMPTRREATRSRPKC